MITQLTEKTKVLIQDFIQHFVDNEVENFCHNYNENEYNISGQLVVEHLKDNFEKIEHDWQLLQDYYNDNYEVKDLLKLKQLSCRYAKTLIN